MIEPSTSSSRPRFHDWKKIARTLRKKPSVWMLTHPDAPVRLVSHVRLRRSPDLRLPDGTIEAMVRNVYVPEEGARRGDVWLRFVPNTTPQKG
jgi:hypothetical protein